MTSKERIKRCLKFQQPDRIGIYDVFLKETIEGWKAQGLPELGAEKYFGCDFQTISLDQPMLEGIDETKFVSISICEPFSQACKELGLQETLETIAYQPRGITKIFNRVTAEILKKASSLLEGPYKFDGVWLYGDFAYQNGLFFSLSSYKKLLLPLHKELCKFFESKHLDIILHSDGDIRQMIPLLIGLGIKTVEPLETESGLDVFELRREYKKDLVLFGNIEFNKLKSSKDALKDEIEKKFGFLKKEGGYIYRMDKDITPDIKLDDYKFTIELVKQYGDYQCL